MDDASSLRREPFWSWSDLLVFVGVGLPVAAVGALATKAVVGLFTSNRAVGILLPQFAGELLMLVPLSLLFKYKYDQTLSRALQLSMRREQALPALAAGVAISIGVLAMAALLKVPETSTPMQKLMEDLLKDPSTVVWTGFFAVVAGPLLEEILFRGLMQPVAIRSAGVVGGVLIAAFTFASLHGPEYGWSWRHVLLILIAGSGFGWCRVRTGSTGAAALMHAAYNSVPLLAFQIGRSAL